MTRLQLLRAWNARRLARSRAREVLHESRRVARRFAHRLTPAQSQELTARAATLRQRLRERGEVATAAQSLSELLDGELRFARRSVARQYVDSVGSAVLVALLLRSFVVGAYQIPSGSMIPTLQVGDHIWVNKMVYGVRIPFTEVKLGAQSPRRGEIIVFSHPQKRDEDLIKRVVAVGGDVVEMRDGVVRVNGVPTERTHEGRLHTFDFDERTARWVEGDADAWHEQLAGARFVALYDPAGGMRTFAPVVVPPGHLFVMGDNRDNSSDSRYWGFVPLNLVRGRAMMVWWSYGEPEGVRVGRFGHLLE